MNRYPLRMALALAFVLTALGVSSTADAQTIVVEGEIEYQPRGYGQAPAGYGRVRTYRQPYAQPYVRTYAPTYARSYVPYRRQIRYEDRETAITALWVPGLILFGVSYGLSGAFGALTANEEYSTWSWIPLVGPWVALSYANTEDETLGATISGVAQAAGLTMFVLGVSLTRTVRVATYAFDQHDDQAPRLAFEALPTPGGAQLGLTLDHF